MNVHDDAERLRPLAGFVPVEAMADLAVQLETVGVGLAEVVGDDETVALVREVLTLTESIAAALTQVRTLIERAAEHHTIGGGAVPTIRPTSATRPRASRVAPEPVEHAGSRYPPDAAWGLDGLPRRVGDGERHTHARIKIGSREIPAEFRSGVADRWSTEARQRLSALGIAAPHYLPYHVELRATAMMIAHGVRDAEIVMNNVPCGYRTGTTRGCHQALDRFLPSGATLTVLGSDHRGRPFRHTYRGRAEP